MAQDDDRRAIYVADGEFYRYRDGLMWNRFKIAATIEAGILYALYGSLIEPLLDKMLLSIGGTILIGIYFRLAYKDAADCEGHLKRMKEFENIAPYPMAKWTGPRGYALTRIGMGLLIVANLILIGIFLGRYTML